MFASVAHKIALRKAIQPILAEIKVLASDGKFGCVFTSSEVTLTLRKHLEYLGYRVELGGSGTMYYVFW